MKGMLGRLRLGPGERKRRTPDQLIPYIKFIPFISLKKFEPAPNAPAPRFARRRVGMSSVALSGLVLPPC